MKPADASTQMGSAAERMRESPATFVPPGIQRIDIDKDISRRDLGMLIADLRMNYGLPVKEGQR